MGKIANDLERRGVCSPNGNSTWSRQAISKLLSNEKYVGYSLLQKWLMSL
ncbi:MAG: recombinase family protein [Clostridiales Family XIII bacterium]|nr:recombinase family protein [Clostridiales Family XIII bacterium]